MPHDSISIHELTGQVILAEAGAVMLSAPEFRHGGRWFDAVSAQSDDVLIDTFNGLLAFVVPGHDMYSKHQGVRADAVGGVGVGEADRLIATIVDDCPSTPHLAATVAALLNGVAQTINLAAYGPFHSPFANLSFAEKAIVFEVLEGNGPFKALARVLPGFVVSFVRSRRRGPALADFRDMPTEHQPEN